MKKWKARGALLVLLSPVMGAGYLATKSLYALAWYAYWQPEWSTLDYDWTDWIRGGVLTVFVLLFVLFMSCSIWLGNRKESIWDLAFPKKEKGPKVF